MFLWLSLKSEKHVGHITFFKKYVLTLLPKFIFLTNGKAGLAYMSQDWNFIGAISLSLLLLLWWNLLVFRDHVVLGTEPRNSCIWDIYSINWATSLAPPHHIFFTLIMRCGIKWFFFLLLKCPIIHLLFSIFTKIKTQDFLFLLPR